MEKKVGEKTLKIVVPAHKPVKRSTLAHILKQAGIETEDFMHLLR